MKKVLSLVLVVALVLSSMSFAFAAKFSDVAGDYSKAITALNGLGVISGYPDGTFKPENSITRAEIAKLLVEALGYKNLATGSTANFSDTKGHWAEGHIALAAGLGLTAGYPDGSFRPDQAISYDEVLTMIIRALGYTDASLKGTWPTNYKVKAIDLKVTKDVVMNKALADRGGVAQALYNALEKQMVEVSDKNIATPVTTGALTLIDKIAKYDAAYEVNEAKLNPEDPNYGGNKVDLAPYMFQTLKVYLNNDKDVVYVKGTNNLVFEGTLKAAGVTANTSITLKDANDETYTFTVDAQTATMLNGVVITDEEKIDYENSNVKVTVVTTAKDGATLAKTGLTAKGLVAEKQTKVAKVSDIYVAGKTKVDTFNLPTKDSKLDLTKVVVTGSAKTLEEIKKNDIVVEYAGIKDDGTLANTKLAVSNAIVAGKVTRVDGNDRYIDGVKYTLNLAADQTTKDTTLNNEGNFLLDHNGKIAKYEVKSGTSNYAAVISKASGEITDSFGRSIKTYERIKLATVNGPVIYDVYLKINSNGEVKGSAITTSAIYSGTINAGTLTSSAITSLTAGDIVKYELNSDGQISKITKEGIANVEFDKEKSNFVLASDVVIFNKAKTDYPVISAEMLKTTGTALFMVQDTAGRIKAMVTNDVKTGETTNYGYVTKVNDAVNAKGDTVKLVVAFINGVKVQYLTDAIYEVAPNTVKALDISGGVITKVANPDDSLTTTVTSISTETNSITVTGGARYFLTKDATILKYDANATTKETVKDLYDIKDLSVKIYFNTKDEVVFMTIGEPAL